MRNLLIIVLILSSLISCSFGINQFEGNWYSCISENQYLEFFTKKDSFKVVGNNGIESSWTYYKLKSDTMYFIKPGGFKTDSSKATFNYNRGKSLSMEFLNSNEKIEFKPLNFVVENPEKDYNWVEMKKRLKNAECFKEDKKSN